MATRIGRILREVSLWVGMTCAVVLWATATRAAPYAAYVMDARTGQVLYQKNANARLHPASLTKMLTLYIAFDAIQRGELSLDTVVTITPHAAAQPPSHLGLRAGQKIKLRYLIRAAAVKSANDAAWAIGDAVSGNMATFVKRMNATAQKLGMTRSHFENPNGLTLEGHLSTAHDMAILGRHLFYDFPQFYNIFSRRSTYAGVAEVYSTNRRFLNSYEGADGIKTGYTYASGFNLVASAKRGDERIIAAEFGGTSVGERNANMVQLLNLGFRRAPTRVAVQKPVKPNLTRIAAMYGRGTPSPTVQVASAADINPASSPRPQARPVGAPPQALIAAMQNGISSALDKAETNAATTVAEAATTPPQSSPRAAPRPAAEAAAQAAPVQLATADITVEPAPPDADRTDIGTDGQPDVPPPPRPAALVAAETASDTPDSDATQTAASAAIAAVAPQTVPDTAAPAQVASAAPVGGTTIEEIQPTAADTAAPVPAADADDGVVFASIAPRQVPAPEARPEIVTRMSTSGGRNWGINVGRFPSKFSAEKALLRVALAENSALRDGLRKVVRRPTGFDATFVGLTQDQAAIACARLQARDMTCFSLAP